MYIGIILLGNSCNLILNTKLSELKSLNTHLIAVVGFILFSLERIATTLGEAHQIPILLAAYGPPTIGILISMGLLLHLEDG